MATQITAGRVRELLERERELAAVEELLRTPAGTIESIVRFGRLGDLAWWGIPRFVRGRYAFEHD